MYLITGGAGFIGSSLAEALVQLGARVRVLDDFSSGMRENLRGLDVDLVEGDIRDLDLLRRAMEGVSYVSHQAALRSVARSVDDPLSTDAVNVHGTLQVLQVYASSSSVYGDSPELPKVETQTPAPVSPYAVSKLAAELYCRVYTRLYGLETVALRYFNVFGPRQSPRSQYAAVVPLFMESARRGEALEIHGDGTQSRDFTHIDNVVQANLLSFEAPRAAGHAFNVACADRRSLLDIVALLERFHGHPLERRHTPRRAGDVDHTHASIDKARELLGYAPRVGFEDGLRQTWEAFHAKN
jgi:nucleoside-diphosphate-sugar epimerase